MDEIVVNLKAWYKSATVWLGSMLIVVAQLPTSAVDMLHPDLRSWAYTVIGAAIIFTRFRGTNQAITLAAAKRPVASDRTEIIER